MKKMEQPTEGHHKDEHHCCHGEGEGPEAERPRNSGAVKYTCPMHPEIVRDEPGNCPKCGMALGF